MDGLCDLGFQGLASWVHMTPAIVLLETLDQLAHPVCRAFTVQCRSGCY